MTNHSLQNEQNRFVRLVDGLSGLCNVAGIAMLVFVMGALTYETVARYFFHAPTQWTQDISVTMQIWFGYLAMALVLRDRKMIRITALLAIAPRWLKIACEALALLIILAFSVIAVTKGYSVLADSIRLGRREPTMLALPNWISELPVVIGFALLALQTMAEMLRLLIAGPPSYSPSNELDSTAVS